MPLAALVLLLLTGTLVPVNRKFRETPGGVPVFVVSNGLHTDVVVPARDSCTGLDWRPLLAGPGEPTQRAAYPFVAFGWGNEKFYRASRGGHMPGVGTTLRAALPSPTLLHVSWWAAAPRPGTRVATIHVSAAQYRALAATIRASFQTDSVGRFVALGCARLHGAGPLFSGTGALPSTAHLQRLDEPQPAPGRVARGLEGFIGWFGTFPSAARAQS